MNLPHPPWRHEGFPSKDLHVRYYFYAIRAISYCIVQTWFVPDEFYQVLEPAHKMVFGYGYLTWEYKEGIRSGFLPMVFGWAYRFLNLIGVTSPEAMNRYFHFCSIMFFAFGDYCTYQLSKIWFGEKSAKWTAVCMTTNWFLAYCAPRTLASCYEMVIIVFAFYQYPWDEWRERESVIECCPYMIIGGMACLVRPTAAVPFLSLAVLHLINTKKKRSIFILIGFITYLTINVQYIIDMIFYKSAHAFSPWKFFQFNVLSGLAATYGTHPWHWYLTHGLPATCGLHLLPALWGVIRNFPRYEFFILHCAATLTVLSCIGHKEFRFLLPIIPFIMIIAGDVLKHTFESVNKYMRVYIFRPNYRRTRMRLVIKPQMVVFVVCLIITNFTALVYFGCYHQRGPMDAIERIGRIAERIENPDVLFLMPCHSTPLYSHIHQNISARFLTCEPNLLKKPDYIDEADLFYIDPIDFLRKEYAFETKCKLDQPKIQIKKDACKRILEMDAFFNLALGLRPLPSHILMFNKLTDELRPLLDANGYDLCFDIFNAYVVDGRRGTSIHIFCKNGYPLIIKEEWRFFEMKQILGKQL